MLRYLEVGYNPLNGILPNSIGNLSSTTEAVNLADAHISGFIPASTGNISGLITLVFKNNNLMGNIPSEIGKLKQLQGLSLSNNKLQRHISEAVCHLSNLVKLFLQVNELSGEIPECIGNLSMLLDLSLGSNKFSSKIPLSLWKMSGLLYFDVSRNSIEGEVTPDIGELKAILELNLSSNNLSGVIPSRLGELLHLQYLDLSNNSFSGQIPFSFSNLISIEYWDLSLYDLSGTIPKSLEKLSYLKSINVSYNVLDGEIPSGGVFANSTLQSFVGNKGLCGMHILEVLPCPITKSGQQSKSKKLVLKIVIPVVTSSFIIFLLVSIWIMKRKKIAKSKDVEKVLDLENEQVCKKFDTECEVMRNVRHRNLIPVITTCSSEYIRAFVLQYIVMLDAAMAIEYLYHCNATPIVHCDLKPSNILLDEDMVAHVGDFGISKILAGTVSTSSDVYSYGIMLMEVLTKRGPTDEEIFNENLDLRKWITQSFSGTIMEVVDANLFLEEEQITSKGEICIAAMVELALYCTKENPESRITMEDVVKRLNKIKNTFLET
ncbi:putative LRR receptor-like serine/threonine-protein kinase FLS2-like [Capsicum annuum]|nr:putative LRR receptor-like serine/threonine-protein kinase FLS2-like [Capsicum annuum]